MTKKEYGGFSSGLLGLTILLVVLTLFKIINTGQAIEIMLLFALVFVTFIYAKRTAEIADATKEQAEEIKEQRLSEARPYLLLRLTERVVQWNDRPNLREHFPPTFPITILNGGKGPAIDLYTALWNKGERRYVYDRKGYLIPGEEWQAEISRFTTLTGEKEGWLPQLRNIVGQNETEIIAVEYKDIHKRTWISYLYLEKHAQDSAFVVAGEHNIMELKK